MLNNINTLAVFLYKMVGAVINEMNHNRVDELISEITNYYNPLGSPVPNDIVNECYVAEQLFGNSVQLLEWVNHRIYLWLLTCDNANDMIGFTEYHELIGLI